MSDRRSPDDDAPTKVICADCGGDAFKGGPITPDADVVKQWEWCAFGPGWRYCHVRDRFVTTTT